MPIYEFLCLSCEKKFEKMQNFDAPNPDCIVESCTGVTAKLISAPAFVLKGSGWYKDGYSKKPSNSKPSD